jgi:hypothetical protein
MNTGHQDRSLIEQVLEQAVDELGKQARASPDPYAQVAGWMLFAVKEIMALDCDGPVVVDQFRARGEGLWNLTGGIGTSVHRERAEYSYESQDGCGKSPRYEAFVSARLVSFTGPDMEAR